jgi:protein-S-isoprenylcysteine O-methyltransferase Ste14
MFTLSFSLITFFWLLELIIHRPDRSKEKLTEWRSLLYIWLALILSILLSALSSHYQFASITDNLMMQYVGLFVYASGVILRWWGIHVLGSNFSRHIKVNDATNLVSDGPYRLLAHPLYFGILLSLTGIALSLNTWAGLLGAWFVMMPVLIYRIQMEERAMTAQFGDSYTVWLKKRRRLIPFIY